MLLSNHPHLVNKYDKSEALRNKKSKIHADLALLCQTNLN